MTQCKNSPPPCGEVGAQSASGGGRSTARSPHSDASADANASALPTLGDGDLESILTDATNRLRSASIDSPRREARLLLAHALCVRQEDIVAGHAGLDRASAAKFEALVARRANREPLAYIVGHREFWSLDFKVGPGVLIPRPETEILIDSALRHFPRREAALDVLDLGTGSGCLLLAFLSERPDARGLGIDASAEAITLARENARGLGLVARAQFINSDWAEATGDYDAIFVNPPYVRNSDIDALEPDVARYEPRAALSGGADGLDCYRKLAPILARRLKPQGFAFVELGQGQAEDVAQIMCAGGLVVDETNRDLSGISRCLVVHPANQDVKKHLEKESRSG